MKILYIFCVLFTLPLTLSKPSGIEDDQSPNRSNRHFETLYNCRKKREVDEEDVINRFEMERVSPIYDILRHLPPFEDGWIKNPVTTPAFASPSPLKSKNESSAYGEFKIEVSKDEEHVVSESGRQFQENSALNWYYSAESYSSVNNFSTSTMNRPKPQTSSPKSTTETKLEETTIPKTTITRKLDEEHVVSHVPSLKGGRGAFLDFNLLESSTTPKIDATLPNKSEEVKPNITTRYILLQSGRIVAINVTSVSSVYKPSSSSGSSNKNPLLPTFYFGSRIRNKNSTKSSVNSTIGQKQEISSTIKTPTADPNTQTAARHTTDFTKSIQQKMNTTPNVTLQVHSMNVNNLSSNKKLVTPSGESFTIKPNVEYSKFQQLKQIPPTIKSHQVQKIPTTNKPEQLKPIHESNKSQQLKEPPVAKKSQPLKEISLTTNTPSSLLRETGSLDPSLKWWNEMKAAKRDRTTLAFTTTKPNISTVPPRNVLQSLYDSLQTSTVSDLFFAKAFDSIKKPTEEKFTHPTIEVAGNARSGKLRMVEEKALHFSTTANPTKASKVSDISVQNKSTKLWTSLANVEINDNRRHDSSTTAVEEDLLEPSVPLTEVRHDFVRIVTLSPPVTPDFEAKSKISSLALKDNKTSSRRARYKGLTHINLQAPIKQTNEFSTVSSRQQFSTQLSYQLTTAPSRGPITFQSPQRWNVLHSSTPSSQQILKPVVTPSPPRSRNGFYLRNSVSFQTMPPGSLTDRRSLTVVEPIVPRQGDENLQPPLEDLLIISFEPTRKTMKGMQNITEEITPTEEKTRNHRWPTKKVNPTPKIAREEKSSTSTAKPHRKVTENPFRLKTTAQSRTDVGSRVGRHFRTNHSRFQNLAENVESTSPISVTTKQSFRVYYFEPKRKKAKISDGEVKNETSKAALNQNPKPTRSNVERTQSAVNRGDTTYRERGRHVQGGDRYSNSRSPKHLELSARERSSTTEATTTLKPTGKRLRSSPFIWHRPNVGTNKPTNQDPAASETVGIRQDTSGGSSFDSAAHNGGIYRSTELHRTG